MTNGKFKSFLQRILEVTKISNQTDLASALGITQSAISQASRKDSIPAGWILQLYRLYGLDPDWVETGRGRPFLHNAREFKEIPKVKARLNAGGGSFEVGAQIEGYYSFRQDWLQTKGMSDKMVLMDIFGNSMEPEIKDGDTVLIDETQKDILAGAIYAVGIEDTIMVKRLEKHPSGLVLLSENRDYPPIHLAENETNCVRIIGKVIWICRECR